MAWNEHVFVGFMWRVQKLSSEQRFYHFQTERHFVRNDFTSGLLLSFYTGKEVAGSRLFT